MTTDAKSDETVEVKVETPLLETQVESTAETPLLEPMTEDKLTLSKMPSTNSNQKEEWRKFGETTSTFLTELQNSVADFFKQNQPLLGSLGWILLALITVKLMLALLEAINDIPLLSLLLELIGLGYVIWFIYRYLLTAASRQELSGELQNFKKQVFNVES